MALADVSTASDAVASMREPWQLVEDLLGGTAAMRKAGERWMPKFPLDTSATYAAKLDAATLLPAFAETTSNMTGRVFAKPLEFTDVPAELEPILSDVDRTGRNAHAFAEGVFEKALEYGVSFVLVDYPVVDPERVKSQADEKAANIRPYWVHITAQQFLGAQTTTDPVTGAKTLTQFRYVVNEEHQDPNNEFSTIVEAQYHVWTPGRHRVIVQTSAGWEVVRDEVVSLPIIPVVPVYAGREGDFIAKPPFLELAYLNVKHWQQQADQDTILHVARVPLLVETGVQTQYGDDGKPVPVQLNGNMRSYPDPNANLRYVEHSGKALAAGSTALDELEEQMKVAGAALLTRTVLSLTEEQAADEKTREISVLQDIAEKMTDALDMVLQLTLMWLRKDGDAGSVSLGVVLDRRGTTAADADVLLKSEAQGVVSKETAFEGLKRAGLVPPDADWETELAKINGQPPAPPVPAAPPVDLPPTE